MSYLEFLEQGAVRAVVVALMAVLSALVMTSESMAVVNGSLVSLTVLLLATQAQQWIARKR